jgi:hypothetical protein
MSFPKDYTKALSQGNVWYYETFYTSLGESLHLAGSNPFFDYLGDIIVGIAQQIDTHEDTLKLRRQGIITITRKSSISDDTTRSS